MKLTKSFKICQGCHKDPARRLQSSVRDASMILQEQWFKDDSYLPQVCFKYDPMMNRGCFKYASSCGWAVPSSFQSKLSIGGAGAEGALAVQLFNDSLT